MADQDTSIVNNDNLLMSYFTDRAIQTLHEKVWYYQLAEKVPLPLGSGQQITFNGWAKISAASSTLAEASGNSSVSLSSRKVNATIISYGRSIKFTDLLEKTSVLPVEPGALRELEHAAALTVDNAVQRAIFKNVLAQVGQNGSAKTALLSVWMSSVASAFCANTSTTSYNANSNQQFGFPVVMPGSATRLSAYSKTAPSISARMGPIALRKGVNRLQRLAVEPMADGMYVGVAHPNALTTMYSNPDWKQWQLNYSGGPQATMYKHEANIVHKVRLLQSPNAPRYAVAAHSVCPVFICGQGALAVTELDGGVKMIITRPGPQSTNDPYHLNSNLAFKVRIIAAVLNPSAGVIVPIHELF